MGLGGASRPVRPTAAHQARHDSRRELGRGEVSSTGRAGRWFPCEQVGVKGAWAGEHGQVDACSLQARAQPAGPHTLTLPLQPLFMIREHLGILFSGGWWATSTSALTGPRLICVHLWPPHSAFRLGDAISAGTLEDTVHGK